MLITGSFAIHIADLDLDPLDPGSVVEGSLGVVEEGARSTWTVHETLCKAYQILLPGT